MGIVNVTPDSFSDGGVNERFDDAVAAGVAMWDAGADIVDVGGESTRPGAAHVSVDVEIARVVPVVAGLSERGVRVSVDTRRAAVAERAIAAGAVMVNDVSGGEDPAMAGVVAASRCAWVLMHMRGNPTTMQRNTEYADLVGEVGAALRGAWARARHAGVASDRLWVDPGVGFGKAALDNAALIAAVPAFAAIAPVLIGASRKSFLGAITGVADPRERDAASLGAALAAAVAGAAMVRVHDVRATIQALQVFYACR